MRTTKEYLNELEMLVDNEFSNSRKRLEADPSKFDEISNEFESTIARFGTDMVHKTILDGLVDSQLSILVTDILKKATLKFSSLRH